MGVTLNESLLFDIGLGATGRPLAIFAKHYGLKVVGIDPVESQRKSAQEDGVYKAVYDTAELAVEREIPSIESAGTKNVVVSVMSGDPKALDDGMDILKRINIGEGGRKILVVFGLFPDSNTQMPFINQDSQAPVTQHQYVFDRMTAKVGDVEVIGICGRRSKTWLELKRILRENKELLPLINHGVKLVGGRDPFLSLFEILKRGEEGIQEALTRKNKVKLAANFFDRRDVFNVNWTEQRWIDSLISPHQVLN